MDSEKDPNEMGESQSTASAPAESGGETAEEKRARMMAEAWDEAAPVCDKPLSAISDTRAACLPELPAAARSARESWSRPASRSRRLRRRL